MSARIPAADGTRFVTRKEGMEFLRALGGAYSGTRFYATEPREQD